MNKMMKSVVTIAIIFGVFFVSEIKGRATNNRLPYIQCQSSLECMTGHCCTISPNRYSIPQCQPMLEEGEVCRPVSSSPLNTTLVYPDGSSVELTDVHYIMCPCVYGLSCDTEEGGICRDPSQKRGFNHLLNEASTQDD